MFIFFVLILFENVVIVMICYIHVYLSTSILCKLIIIGVKPVTLPLYHGVHNQYFSPCDCVCRYNKCVECYNHMMSIRAFLLKRQTVQGKMGTVYRELVILMQAFE